MRRRAIAIAMQSLFLALALVLPLNFSIQAGSTDSDSLKSLADKDTALALLPIDGPAATQYLVDTSIVIPVLDFANTPLYDALTALARAHNLSVYVDTSVTGSLTLRLNNVRLNDALTLIAREKKLRIQRTGEIIEISRLPEQALSPASLSIGYGDGLLSMKLDKVDLAFLVDTLSELTHRNIILEDRVKGKISGKIVNLNVEKALGVLLPSNGFTLSCVDSIIYVGQEELPRSAASKSKGLSVFCEDGRITADFINSSVADALGAIATKCNFSLVLQTKVDGTISASLVSRNIDEALVAILQSTPYTFKISNLTIFVGGRESEGLFETRLVKFSQLIAATAEDLIPASLSKQVVIKVSKEHNGLVLTGPRTAIAQVEDFLATIDIPVAQVLFEVLVVDFNTTDRSEFSLFATNRAPDSLPSEVYYPFVDLNRSGDQVNRDLNSWSRRLGIGNLGTLSDDFYIRLRALAQKGKANIRSQPQIASMNGHSASIKIGTTQYYLLESQTIYPSQQTNVSTQTSQRFEKIEANMSLEVTPYVNLNGELVVEVKPEFNSPVGTLDPDVPPTINRRELSSMVRLRDGETIVLGGLVEEAETATIDKFPILGSIPIIGRIFQNRSKVARRSDLMIYITPHVYYGSEGKVQPDGIGTK